MAVNRVVDWPLAFRLPCLCIRLKVEVDDGRLPSGGAGDGQHEGCNDEPRHRDDVMEILERINSTSWGLDYRRRSNPELLTQLLQEAVPVLGYVNWQMTETREGYARSVLPLNAASTNQHGTHQATLLALAADYTGGTALGTLIRGVPIIGVHPQPDRSGAALWLASIEMKYQAPSAADVTVEALVSPDRWERIRRRYAQGQTVLETLAVRFLTEDDVVATGTYGFFLRQASALTPATVDARLNPLFAHKSKASARLIAGVRAAESARAYGLIKDGYAERMAGPHGRLLADHFTQVLPQLGPMVAARTRDIDDLFVLLAASGLEQVVIIGAGLCARPFRLAATVPTLKVFELDLPHMLEERHRALSRIPALPDVQRVPVHLNLQLQDIDTILDQERTYNTTLPTLFILEGLTMYQTGPVNERIFRGIRRAMRHPGSMLWVDTVRQAVIDRRTGFEAGDAFVDGIEKLGEPFIFGLDLDQAPRFFQQAGFSVRCRVTSNDYFAEQDPVFGFYDFWHLQPSDSIVP
jgi:methyltransferase (TIGR00027 family)